MAVQGPPVAVAPLEEVKVKLAIVLPWTEVGVVVPTDREIARKRLAMAPATVQAVPAAEAEEPPMKLLEIVKLLPEVLERMMPPSVAAVVLVRVAVWYRLLPEIVQSVFPVAMLMPQSAAARLVKSKMLLLEIVMLLLFWAKVVVVPEA